MIASAASSAASSPHAPGQSAADRRLPSVPAMDTCEPWRLALGRAAALSADDLREWDSALERPTCVQEVHLSAAYSKHNKENAPGPFSDSQHQETCCRHASTHWMKLINLHAKAA